MEYKPFKCPDCKVWWRGETHKCADPVVTVKVNPPATVSEKDPWSINPNIGRNKYKCVSCGKDLSKSEVSAQHIRCNSCRIKRLKGYGKYGYGTSYGNA